MHTRLAAQSRLVLGIELALKLHLVWALKLAAPHPRMQVRQEEAAEMQQQLQVAKDKAAKLLQEQDQQHQAALTQLEAARWAVSYC